MIRKWSAVASFTLAAAFLAAPLIYLTGNLRSAFGPVSYHLADFLYGPLWAACLVGVFMMLQAELKDLAPRRASLALMIAILAAGTMVMVALIRSANRQYHIGHPELHLENASAVLVVWGTLLTGLTSAGWHFLGWALLLVGSAGWSSGRLPKLLCLVYLIAGLAGLLVYLIPELEGAAAMLGVLWAIWQGVFFWRTGMDKNLPDR